MNLSSSFQAAMMYIVWSHISSPGNAFLATTTRSHTHSHSHTHTYHPFHVHVSTFPLRRTQSQSPIIALHESSSSSSSNNNKDSDKNKKKRFVSSAQQEREREEQRRLERKNEIQIGKSSAIAGAKNYQLNVEQTQMDLISNQYDDLERQIWKFTEQGMKYFKLLQLEEAEHTFEKAHQLNPSYYLWQYGIVLFYLEKYHKAAEIFAINAKLYESKFGEPASEERIWRDACELKLWNGFTKKEQEILLEKKDEEDWVAQIQDTSWSQDDDEFGISPRPIEKRKILRYARDLFQSAIHNDLFNTILSQMKLRSITGPIPIQSNQEQQQSLKRRPRPDWKMWKHNSWFYLGLYYDVTGKTNESKVCMKMALQQNVGSINSDDINKLFPVIHMSRRDWYDDDDFENSVMMMDVESGILSNDPEDMIKALLDGARKTKLQDTLQKEGLATTGSKSDLSERLLKSLLSAPLDETILG